MLHGLAGFIFGGGTVDKKSGNAHQNDPQSAGRVDQDGRRSHDDRIKNAITENTPVVKPLKLEKQQSSDADVDDEDWLLVDVSCDETDATNCSENRSITANPHPPGGRGDWSPTVEERGWNVTPPPCFTASYEEEHGRIPPSSLIGDAGGFVSIRHRSVKIEEEEEATTKALLQSVLETSNFENLLIEHPSMSVYGRIMPVRRIAETAAVVVTLPPTPTPNPTPTPEMAGNTTKTQGSTNRRVRRSDGQADENKRQQASRRSTMELLLGKDYHTAGRVTTTKSPAVVANHNQRQAGGGGGSTGKAGGTPRKRRMKYHPAGRCNDRKCQ